MLSTMICLLTFVIHSTMGLLFTSCPLQPSNLPSNIQLTVANFVNWDRELHKNNLWMTTPLTPDDVVRLANWANQNSYKLRASGFMHGWAPITITNDTEECGKTILVNTISHLNKMEMIPNLNQVKVQTGSEMNVLLQFLENKGYGFYNIPAPGDITVGGALTIGAHGTSIPAKSETTFSAGYSFGSLSDLIVSFTAVVWDNSSHAYVLKTFQRSDPDATSFFVSLGRTFLTEVTLTVVTNYNMRCVSRMDIPMDELCADSTSGRTASSFLDETGRLEMILFPFTDNPWLKIWSVNPSESDLLLSRKVDQPYNYIFSDNIPTPVAQLVGEIIKGAWHLTPILGNTLYLTTQTGLVTTLSADIWGKSKNVLLYIKPTTVLYHSLGYVVLTRRDNIQKVLNSFFTYYKSLAFEYARQGKYPANGPIEVRFNSLEQSIGSDFSLSALHSLNDNRSFDVGIWLNVLSIPNSPYMGEFMTKLQSFVLKTFNDHNSTARPEWTKGYAYTADGAWKNVSVLNSYIPNSYANEWRITFNTLNKYDPNRIFTNPFLDSLLVA